jgi:hypothetical protein
MAAHLGVAAVEIKPLDLRTKSEHYGDSTLYATNPEQDRFAVDK